mmetsp:Transcript_7505/g.11192  ORF Transcript_7505/g.11192 Transcript_7505/m.11192 type:complete len:346 (+) Transcript_7505:1261-2298(+)
MSPLILVLVGKTKDKSMSNLFLTLHLVQQLLHRGHRVRVSFSCPDSTPLSEIEKHFFQLSGSENVLEVVDIDEGFVDLDYSFSGEVVTVYLVSWNSQSESLTTSSVEFDTKLVAPIKKVLDMCSKSLSVKKVILTSCIVTLTHEIDNSKTYTEADWNTSSSASYNSYAHSKTTGEKFALNYASTEGCKFNLVVIVSGMMLGPHLATGSGSFSYRFLTKFLHSQRVYPNMSYCIADVRDVANSHVLAMENAELAGRFIVSHNALHLTDVLQIVHENFVDLQVPTYMLRDFVVRAATARDVSFRGQYLHRNVGKALHINNSRAREAGMVMRPQSQTIVDTIRYDHGR